MNTCARYADAMSEEEKQQGHEEQGELPAETPGEPLGISLAGKVTSSGHVRARLIQHSPVADPKLVQSARKVARELKKKKMEKKADSAEPPVEPPLILPVP